MREVIKQDLENRVVSLRQTSSFELPATHRATSKFLVVRDNLFSHDYYGDVLVFNLRNNRAVSRVALSLLELQGMATDGDFLYIHLRQDFNIGEGNILIAKCPPSKRDRGEEEYVECKFVGKPVRELRDEAFYGRAEDRHLSGRIVSFPLDKILQGSSSIVFNPSSLAGEPHTFLVHNDMSSVHLFSGGGYATVRYNYHFGEGGCNTSFRLKNGEISTIQGAESDGLPLEFHDGRNIDGQIHAMVDVYDDSPEIPESERDRSVRLPVVMDRNFPSSYGILGLQHTGSFLHVLYDQIRSSYDGITHVSEPNWLISYEVSVKKLVSTEE